MDFFANAFITRDVADNDDDSVVVKDGIQIREKETTLLSSGDIVNCEICGLATAKYKCPGCFCQTCSLKCSKQHKLDTTCSGVRSRTHFVERKQYNEKDMMSDYNFLEDVGRTVDNASRENLKLDSELTPNKKRSFGANNNNSHNKKARNNKSGEEATGMVEVTLTAAQELERQVPENSGTYRDKQLAMQARRRGTQLIRMADGLKKRKENNTHWRDKPSRILWTIEWLFPEIDTTRRLLEHKNDDLATLKDMLSTALMKPDNGDVAKRYPEDVLEKCHFYFVIPLRHANQPALYPLKGTDSLQDALKFKKVLEYPTILVVGPSPSSTSAATQSSSTQAADTVVEAENNETRTTGDPADPTFSTSDNTSPVSVADHSHPALKKYIIEEAPTQWPKRAAAAVSASVTGSREQNNSKPSNDTNGESEDASKKAKLKEGDNDEEEESSDDSSDDSSSDSDSDSDDSDDSSDDDSDDSADEKEIGPAAPAEDTKAKEEAVDLAIGQAVMDAFNEDFGQPE